MTSQASLSNSILCRWGNWVLEEMWRVPNITQQSCIMHFKVRKFNSGHHSVQFSCSVMSDFLWPHGLQHARSPCPLPTLGIYSNSCPLSQWWHLASHFLSSPFPPAFNLSQPQGLFQWIHSSHKMARVLGFQLQHQSFQWTPRTDFLQDGLVESPWSPRDSQESSPTPQFRNKSSSWPW